jgi:hypothetical protein
MDWSARKLYRFFRHNCRRSPIHAALSVVRYWLA